MKGSPGAILFLALGAAFLSLGWTGRYAAVWEAFRTGKSDTTSQPDTVTDTDPDNPSTADGPGDWIQVTTVPDNKTFAILWENLQIPPAQNPTSIDAPAPSGFTKVEVAMSGAGPISGRRLWVRTGDLVPMTGGKLPTAAGQVVTSNDDFNSIVLPNGSYAFTRQPNPGKVFGNVG